MFSDDPKVRAWKESSVARWRAVEVTRGGVSPHHQGSPSWVVGWGESAALNPAKEERAALEKSTNPVYQVSSQHSSRHTGLGVKERRARLRASRQQCRFQQRDEILPCLRARELHVGQEDGNMRIKSIWAGLAMEKPEGEGKPGVGNWYGG